MPTDQPWTADIQAIYESIHEITPHDEATFRDADYSEERLREAFETGFLTRTEDDVSADERAQAREEFFEWMAYLGYDANDFDWEAWKEWMGYE